MNRTLLTRLGLARLGLALLGGAMLAAAPALAQDRVFHIATVHLDGSGHERGDALHPQPEPYPAQAALPGGGHLIRRVGADGAWNVRMFLFEPSQIVVRQGETVVLIFVGVHGPAHEIVVDGVAEPLRLRRGETASVRLVAQQPGSIRFASKGREPTMAGEVLVLPAR
jgi:plastocyanin